MLINFTRAAQRGLTWALGSFFVSALILVVASAKFAFAAHSQVTMRTIVLLLFCVACGCASSVIDTEVSDSARTNRLLLVKLKTQSPGEYLNNTASYDFDSLKWQTKAGSKWKDHIVIRCADFQGTSSRPRLVSAIHSINPATGTAVIKVAEGDVPANSPVVHYVYSWREWNLISNNEVRTIRACKDPFEKY